MPEYEISGKKANLSVEAVVRALKGATPEPVQDTGVEVEGVLFPIAQALELATGIERSRTTPTRARAILSDLGVPVFDRITPAEGDRDDLALYQAIVARRLQWDNLLWQVPVLSLTAQAFLLTIALGHDSSNWARLLAGGLSFLAALVSMVLMAGHRHAELTDAAWLARYEADHFRGNVFHGLAYKIARDATPMLRSDEQAGPRSWFPRFFAGFAQRRTFNYWMGCLMVFGLTGLGASLYGLIWGLVRL
jgi:hypothetical protein